MLVPGKVQVHLHHVRLQGRGLGTVEIPLKWKYRCPKPKGGNPSRGNGNSGQPVRGTPPKGLRKRPKGKTSFK